LVKSSNITDKDTEPVMTARAPRIYVLQAREQLMVQFVPDEILEVSTRLKTRRSPPQ
jgi:hypothetical protein